MVWTTRWSPTRRRRRSGCDTSAVLLKPRGLSPVLSVSSGFEVPCPGEAFEARPGPRARSGTHSLTVCQRLLHHVLDRDAGGAVRHPLVDEAVDLELVLAQGLDGDDGGDLFSPPCDDRGLVLAVGPLDDGGGGRLRRPVRFLRPAAFCFPVSRGSCVFHRTITTSGDSLASACRSNRRLPRCCGMSTLVGGARAFW